MDTLTERAPAKLNLCLYVGPKRADGLHEICSLLCAVSLFDELRLEPADGTEDEVVCTEVDGPNLAMAALSAFRERFDWNDPPVRITIDKKIPVAAGLGGGSADAAATLRLAIHASQIEPPPDALRELAMSLGADVPSQIAPGAKLVIGAGERLEPLNGLTELAAVLLTSEERLSTRDVYALADSEFPPRANLGELAARLRQAAAKAHSPLEVGNLLHNDLQGAAITLEPTAADALDLLRDSGAKVALVSGSGPTVFGLYQSAAQAERARVELSAQWSGEAVAVGSVARGDRQTTGGTR